MTKVTRTCLSIEDSPTIRFEHDGVVHSFRLSAEILVWTSWPLLPTDPEAANTNSSEPSARADMGEPMREFMRQHQTDPYSTAITYFRRAALHSRSRARKAKDPDEIEALLFLAEAIEDRIAASEATA